MKRAPLRTAALITLVAGWALLPLLSISSMGGGPQTDVEIRLPTSQAASGIVASRLGSFPSPGLETGTLDSRPQYLPPEPEMQAPTAAGLTCCFLRFLAKQPPTLRGPPSSTV